MSLKAERGEGRFSSFIALAVLFAGGYALWNVVPVYYANGNLKDKMTEVARLPRYQYNDDRIRELLMKEVQDQGLAGIVLPNHFAIQTFDHSRKITVEYDRMVDVFPKVQRKFHFKESVDQPLI